MKAARKRNKLNKATGLVDKSLEYVAAELVRQYPLLHLLTESQVMDLAAIVDNDKLAALLAEQAIHNKEIV